MEKHEAIQILMDMRDNCQHNHKMYQQQIEMKDRGVILAELSKKISALTLAMNYLEHYG
jgi:hypothetical protein